MGYNACYGLQYNDSMTMEPVKTKHEETENFLEQDICGNLFVKREFAHCDICGKKIEQCENSYIHGSYMYCRKCELNHRKNARIEKKINNKKQKGTKK